MEWTAEQLDEMRVGRPTYGDKNTSGALTWLRTSEEIGGEYSLVYADVGPGYTVFPHYHTSTRRLSNSWRDPGPGGSVKKSFT